MDERNKAVYVIDDDGAAANSLAAMLSSAGMTVETYSSGEEFHSAYDSLMDGCLLIDVRLPGMNGLDLLKKIREDGCSMPSIFISGHADQQIRDCALDYGTIAFFEKPFDGRKLCETVMGAIG